MAGDRAYREAILQQSERKHMEVIMPNSFRMFALSGGFLLVTGLGCPSAQAASFVNGTTVCLDDEGGVSTNGNPVRSFPCNVTNAQFWMFTGVQILGPGTVFGAGKCLDVKGSGTASGTPVDLFDCNGTGAQQWRYLNSQLVNLGSGKCLDVGTVVETKATIQTCSDSAGQKWNIQ
jgi:Ricin-type beta-trefoil lectin domain